MNAAVEASAMSASSAPATMVLELLDARRSTLVKDIISVIAEDATGQFGLLPGHEPVLTVLEPGILRFRQRKTGDDWHFAACTGGMLRSNASPGQPLHVQIVSRRFLFNDDPDSLQAQLQALRLQEGRARQSSRGTTEQMDRSLYQRLQELAEGVNR